MALENGVSKYPVLEGRFPQVAGITYGFDPDKPPGQRVSAKHVKVQGSYLDLDRVSMHRNFEACSCRIANDADFILSDKALT